MNKLLLSTLTILFTLLFSANSFSQSFRPGFIVQAEGDTLQGLIKYRESDRSYKSCVFKKGVDSETKEYFPEDIVAYGIANDAMFESKVLTNAKGEELKVFVEALVHGRLNLYQYKNLFFLQKKGGPLQLVTITTDDTNMGGRVGERRVVTASTNHIILINSLTLDCTVPEELLAKVLKKMSAPAMIAIAKSYNNCIDPQNRVVYKENKPWTSLEAGVLIGSHTSTIHFGAGPFSIKDTKFPAAHNFIAGGYLKLTAPRKSERLSFHVEPFYSQEKYLGYSELQAPLTSQKNDYTIELKRLSVVTMARYSFAGTDRLTPYFGVGVSNNFILDGNGVKRSETETTINDERQIETTITDNFLLKKFYIVATAAIGTTYSFSEKHKVLFQLRYEKIRFTPGRKIALPDYSAQLDSDHSFYLTAAYILK